MVELQQGTLLEERRGGSAILSTLISDMIENSVNGYIRCERIPKDDTPKVGQLVVNNREIVAAFYESKRPQYGTKAVKNIEADCQELDCVIQVFTGVDIPRVLDIYPESRIQSGDDNGPQKWWEKLGNRQNTWTRSRRSPVDDNEILSPEFSRRNRGFQEHNHTGEELLKPGSVYLNDSDELFQLVSNLEKLGRPLLVLSRLSNKEYFSNIGINNDSIMWITRKEGDKNILPEIKGIEEVVSEFLAFNIRAVMLFDGLEYLSSIHGTNNVINLVRDLADKMRFEDDCLFIHTYNSTWTKQDFTQLSKIAPVLDTEIIQSWNENYESLEGHPLLAPLTDEEISQMEEYIKINTPETVDVEPVPKIVEIEEIAIEETVEEIVEEIEEVVEDIPEQIEVKPKGPRTAQVVKRRKAKHVIQDSSITSSKSRLSAAIGKEIDIALPAPKNIPKTVIGSAREGKLPEIPSIIPSSLGQVVKQKSATKDLDLPTAKSSQKTIKLANDSNTTSALSPVAARGIEIKKNLTNRSQASSRPQRKLNLDKKLKGWIKEDSE